MKAQNTNFTGESVAGLPTKIVYDLLVDRQNFLWLATEIGVFRYDGITFTLFSSPQQSSLSSSGLIQDNEGKIWFHTFTGQILYIDNERTYLLKSYDSHSESKFPRITIHKNSLMATSDHGLFICDTKTLHSRYLQCDNCASTATTSLTTINDIVVAYGNGNWFIHNPGVGLRKAKLDAKILALNQDVSSLHIAALGDTAYLVSNPSSTIQEIGVRNDSILLFKRRSYRDFINNISFQRGKIWINLVKQSISLHEDRQLNVHNISDIVTDQEGNIWYSSLDKGLLVDFKQTARLKINLPGNDDGDYIRTMVRHHNLILLGTQHGRLYLYDHMEKRFINNFRLPRNFDSIYKIAYLENDEFLVGTSINTYKLSLRKGIATLIPSIKILKQTDQTNDLLFLTTATRLIVSLKRKSEKLQKQVVAQFKGLTDYDSTSNSFFYPKRCSALSYYPEERALFVAFKTGLFKFDHTGLKPVTYKGGMVYTLYIAYHGKKIYIGTINNGLLVYDNGNLRKYSIEDGLLSENIVSLKKTGSQLWILSSTAVQMFDMDKSEFYHGRSLSTSDNMLINDLVEIDNNVYFATEGGLYVAQLIPNKSEVNYIKLRPLLLVNGRFPDRGGTFSPDHNNLQFKITLPTYQSAKQTYIRYSLVTSSDSSLEMTGPGERSVNFASLKSGKYTFIGVAIHPELGQVTEPITYQFEILHSWWQDEFFQLAVIFSFAFFIIYILIDYYLKKENFKKTLYRQQESIKEERQRISSEIHDDIGAGIFAIKLFADVASKNEQKGNSDIGQIAEMVNEISSKIREIIWSTNTENDNLADLILYMKFQSVKLFEHSEIAFTADIPEKIPDLAVSGKYRKNIYLLVQEFIHNAIKHAYASTIRLEIVINEQALFIQISDNGRGFDLLENPKSSMGLKNAQSRIRSVGGKFSINFDNGTVIFMEIPLP